MRRYFFSLIFLLVLMVSGFAMPPPQTPEQAAQDAAEAWLRLIDAGKYAESWDELAEVAKAKVSKASWETLHNEATASDASNGNARKLMRAQSTSSLMSTKDMPGVTLAFRMREDSHGSITEIVELVQEETRGWRVAFYVKMSNTFLFWPSSSISSHEKLDDHVPIADPKELPRPEPVPHGTGGGVGYSVGGGVGNEGAAVAVDQRPVPLNMPKPRYTEEARRNQVVGVIILRALVGADGAVKQVRIVRGLPDGLDEEAVRAAYSMRFRPAMKDGKPVPFWLPISMEFNLK